MDLTYPAAAVVPALRARVLMVLARADAGLTGRKIAALAEGSVAGVAPILKYLVHQGLVHRINAGSASLYTLNRDHLGAAAVLSMAEMRAELIRRLGDQFVRFTHRPLSATLFGSAARGDGEADSDIDVLLVRPASVSEDDVAWSRDVSRLGSAVLAWTGNQMNAVEYATDDLAASSASRRRLLDAVERDGVLLHGTDLRTLRR